MANRCDAGTSSRRRNYKQYYKKAELSRLDKIPYLGKSVEGIRRGHKKRDLSGKEYILSVKDTIQSPVVQQMKQYNHHSHTNCFEHSVHVSYYNYLICKKFGWDTQAAARGGLLHDLFLYDWHHYEQKAGERMHGFEHPTKALKNAQNHFDITRKEGDIIAKHMFPLTITPPKYKESYVIVMTDKFCSVCEVMDRFFKQSKRKTFYPKKNRVRKNAARL